MFKLPTFPSTHLATTFCYSSHHVSKKGYSHDLDYLPAVDWADMNKLASIHVSLMIVPSMDASLKQWVNTFKRVGSIEAKASVSVYALEIAKYLESKEGEDLYREAFDLELSNKSLNQRAEAVGKNTRKVLKLKEAQKLNQEEHQSIASSSSTSRHLKAKIVIKRPLEFEEVPVQKARRTLRSKSTLDSAATLFSEHSFTSDDSDETYQQVEEREVQEDKIRTKTFYYMSMHEIDHSDGIKESSIKFFFDGMTFEERADLSSIEIITADKSQLLPVSFSRQFQAIVDQYRRSISFHTEVKLNDVDSMNDKEKGLSCALYLQSKQLQKQIESLPCALSMKFKSTEGNAELNFAMKHVFLLFDTLFTASDLSIDWDTMSNIYSSYPHDATQACRHDMIITSSEGLEIGTGEIKPPNTADELVEVDRSRVAESLKKQLHRRLYFTRNQKELSTFGILIAGNRLELTKMTLSSDGHYEYQLLFKGFLATTSTDYAFIQDTLEIMLSFICLAEASLLSKQDEGDDLIMNKFAHLLKPTVYTMKSTYQGPK